MPLRHEMKKGLRTAVISLALCTLFVGSLALADDCKDALIAESCACQSAVRSERNQLSALDKTSLGEKEARARNRAKALRVADRCSRSASVGLLTLLRSANSIRTVAAESHRFAR